MSVIKVESSLQSLETAMQYLEIHKIPNGHAEGRFGIKSKTRKWFAYSYSKLSNAENVARRIEGDFNHQVEAVNFSYDYPHSIPSNVEPEGYVTKPTT